jgi:hypothetical protein
MDTITIGLEFRTITARDEHIIQTLANAQPYYEDDFYRAISLNEIHKIHNTDYIPYSISHDEDYEGTNVIHTIIYKFKYKGAFQKTKVREILYNEWNKLLNK